MRTSWRVFSCDQPGALTVLHDTQQTAGVRPPIGHRNNQQQKEISFYNSKLSFFSLAAAGSGTASAISLSRAQPPEPGTAR